MISMQVPSVFIVQLPRFGMQKIYKRIRLNAELDISKVLSSGKAITNFSCILISSSFLKKEMKKCGTIYEC